MVDAFMYSMDSEQTEEVILESQNHSWSIQLKALGMRRYKWWNFVAKKDLLFDMYP
jgi:hypothetical protein